MAEKAKPEKTIGINDELMTYATESLLKMDASCSVLVSHPSRAVIFVMTRRRTKLDTAVTVAEAKVMKWPRMGVALSMSPSS